MRLPTTAIMAASAPALGFALLGLGSPLLAQSQAIAAPPPELPSSLIEVPDGKVTVGTEADALWDTVEVFQPRDEKRKMRLLRKLMSELGAKEHEVDSYFLSRYPVTNEQYLEFVKATGHRFPYHWWKEGKPDHFEAMRVKAKEAYPGETGPEMFYWEQYYRDLPYAIPEGQEQFPVTFVSRRDALAFAAWAGTRLPTEAEWVFAATGAEPRQFLWGDEWERDWLKKLRIASPREQKIKRVGELGELARGPFGHEDMVGNVWEWTDVAVYYPVNGDDLYRRELDRLKKKKFEEKLEEPDFKGAAGVTKGASYFSWQDPAELRVQTRAYLGTTQTIEGVGFRLAKTHAPARDMARSRIALEFDPNNYGEGQSAAMDRQVGIERYDLGEDGRLIKGYSAIAIVPYNHLAIDGTPALGKLRETLQERPIAFGVLVSSVKLAEPELEPGTYLLAFRQKGMPKELVDAIKVGNRAVMARRKAEAAGQEPPEEEEGKWKGIVQRYGITEDDLAEKDAAAKIKHVVIGKRKIDTTKSMILVRNNDGECLAAFETDDVSASGKPKDTTFALDAVDGKDRVKVKLWVQWSEKSKSKSLPFSIELKLDSAPDAAKPWRLPE